VFAQGNVGECAEDGAGVVKVHDDDLPAFCAKIIEEFAEGRHEVAHAGATSGC
jgi:protease I